jgi:hypothetical protein
MKEISPELTRQVLQPAMHAKLLLRAAELVTKGWSAGRPHEMRTARRSGPQRRRPPT